MPRELTITLKYGKSYDDSWAVFKGTPNEVRDDIVSFFGFNRESVAELTLNDLVVEATNLAHGKGNAARFLSAVTIPASEAPPPAPASASSEDPWAAAGVTDNGPPWDTHPVEEVKPAAQPKAEDPDAWILGEIENQTSVAGLKRLWAENQSMFNDKVLAAWKAKGRALK